MRNQTLNEHTVRVTRTIEFSAAHFYRQDLMSETQNRAAFGACFTPYGHGHNYRFEVLVEGVPNLSTGLLVERPVFDTHLKKVVETLDHHHANFDVPEFKARVDGSPTLIPTTENLCLYLVNRLKQQLSSDARFKMVGAKLFEMADLSVEWTDQDLDDAQAETGEMSSALWMHEVSFRAVHRLAVAGCSDNENLALFGHCSREHGHHYRLQVTLQENPELVAAQKNKSGDLKTQPLIQRLITQPEFEQILESHVTKKYDGTNLNLVLPGSSQMAPQPTPQLTRQSTPHSTPEALLIRLFEDLRVALQPHPSVCLAKLMLFDGENGSCEISI